MTSSKSIRLILLVLALAGILAAQVGTQGTILGVVQDSSGAVIPGAEVKVTRTETGIVHTATSDASGNFQIRALPIGHYSVTGRRPASRPGRSRTPRSPSAKSAV